MSKKEPKTETGVKDASIIQEQPKATSMDDLTVNEIMPEVQENAIAAVSTQNEQIVKAEITVSTGKVNKDGTPAKKRGRKAGQTNSFVGGVKKKEEENLSVSSEYAARVISGLLERASVVLISEEFILSEVERTGNVIAWRNALDHYGGVNLTPPQALVLDHLGIIMARIPQPKTQTKVKLFTAFIADKMAKFKKKKKVVENAHIDSGSDVKRENDIRKEESPST